MVEVFGVMHTLSLSLSEVFSMHTCVYFGFVWIPYEFHNDIELNC